MATTTAKKKPVKKTTKATTKKTASKSVEAPSNTTSKKVTESKSISTAKKRTIGPFDKLRAVHFSNFFSGIILAVLTVLFVNPFNKDLLLDYQAKDVFIKSDAVNLGPATEVLLSLDIRYVLVVALGLTSIFSLLLATRLYKKYEESVKAGISGLRWLLYSIVGVLILEVALLSAGVQDVVILKSSGALIILAGLMAWLSERENANSKTPKKLAFYGSVFAHLLAILPLLISLLATLIIDGQRFGWFVYVISAAVLLGYVATLVTLKAVIVNKKSLEYIAYEQRFVRIDQLVKFVIVLTIFSAFNK